MAPEHIDCAWLERYLQRVGILERDDATEHHVAITPLAGGTANFVWRVVLPSGAVRVAKHAEPFVKDNPAIALAVDRQLHEANALSLLPQVLSSSPAPTSPSVRLPTLHHADPDAHVLTMSDDAGTASANGHLKRWYGSAAAAAAAADVPPVGAALGAWLAQLHARTRNLRTSPTGGDNATAKAIYRHAYANLAAAFAAHGLDPAYARAVDAEFGARLASDDECVCHGDFWPGNVLVRGEDGEGQEQGQEGQDRREGRGEKVTLTVVDWELTRRGTGATDVAQFAAEAWLLDRFQGGKGLLGAFLGAYVVAVGSGNEHGGGVDKGRDMEGFVQRLVVHFGVHVAFWPTRVEWCGKEETGALVRFGKGCIEAGWGRDWAAVEKGPLAPVLELLK